MANNQNDNEAYRRYLRSLVSEETSSDEEREATPPPPVRFRKRKGSRSDPNANRPKYSRENISEQEQHTRDDYNDPQEGTSRGPTYSRRVHQNLENDPDKRTKVGNIFDKGMVAFSDKNIDISIQSVANQRNTRFRADDHLYQINIKPHRRTAPLLLSLEEAIREALAFILLKLKPMYGENLHHQIYITIIEQNIIHGLNTGNYDLNAPSNIIINRAMTILHSYLKSKQTLRLNNSFKIQIKVLSHRHTNHLMSTKPTFKKHVYRNYSRFRN